MDSPMPAPSTIIAPHTCQIEEPASNLDSSHRPTAMTTLPTIGNTL